MFNCSHPACQRLNNKATHAMQYFMDGRHIGTEYRCDRHLAGAIEGAKEMGVKYGVVKISRKLTRSQEALVGKRKYGTR